MGFPRREALHDLKKRTEVPGPSKFVLMLTLTQVTVLVLLADLVLTTPTRGPAAR